MVYTEGDANKHSNTIMEKRQKQLLFVKEDSVKRSHVSPPIRGIFVANEPARVSKRLPVYDACPVCVDGHEISIFRCVVWMEIICECC